MRTFVNYDRKIFIILRPGANVIKLFTVVNYNFRDKLDCLLLVSLSRLVYCLWVRPGAYARVEHLKGASLW
jgi:hypothetical protein